MIYDSYEEEMQARNFVEKVLILLDSSYQPRSDRSVYVYMDAADRFQLWYVFNDQGLYFSVFDDLDGLMDYIIDRDTSKRCFSLTEKDMEEIDAKL